MFRGVMLVQWSSVAPSTSSTRDRVRTWAEICWSQSDSEGFSPGTPVFLPLQIDFHAKIWAVERLNISLWLGRMGNHFLRNWRKIKYLLNSLSA